MRYLVPFVGSVREPAFRARVAKQKERPALPAPAVKKVKKAAFNEDFTAEEYAHALPKIPSLIALFLEVCTKHGIPPNILVGGSRVAAVIEARKEFCYRAHVEAGYQSGVIARAIKRDASTVCGYIRAGGNPGPVFTRKNERSKEYRTEMRNNSRRPHTPLMGTQIKIKALLDAGETPQRICGLLGLSDSTAAEHLRLIERKLKWQAENISD